MTSDTLAARGAPERIWAWPSKDRRGWYAGGCSDTPTMAFIDVSYILATPTALAASPEVAKLIAEAEARGMERAAKMAWDAANAANMDAEDEHQRGLSEAAFHLRHEAEAIARVASAIHAEAAALKGA